MKSNAIALSFCILVSVLFVEGTLLFADQAEEQFNETVSLYKNLATDPEKVKDPEIWDLLARAFYSIYLDNPESTVAPNSLFFSGKMYEEIGNRFNSREDLEKSVDRSTLFIRAYPKSDLADDAQIRKARIIEGWDKKQAYLEYERVKEDFPDGDMAYAAKEKLKDLSPFKPSKREKALANANDGKNDGLVKIKEIRHWSTDTKTRVVIHLDKEMPYKSFFLKPDSKVGTPPRLLVDILGTTVEKDLPVEPVDKGLLEKIKFGRNTPDKVRVVLYIKSFEDYRVFSLNNPFRIVMDIDGDSSKRDKLFAKDEDSKDDKTVASIPKDDVDISTLRGVLGLKVKTIVIDPGHGGHDTGAVGPTGLKEKDVNLKIAKALKSKIEQNGNNFGVTRVFLTRDDDRFIPLEERTAIAKKLNADLFVSIHCNAARNKNAYGIETYILSFTKDPDSLAVAARENATTTRSLSDLKDIIQKYILSSKIEESKRLANHVQTSVVSNVSNNYKPVNNKGVKKAPFIVLIGADIPSILVESSFISNPREEKRLKSKGYVNEIAQGIYSGIKRYSTEVETAALMR